MENKMIPKNVNLPSERMQTAKGIGDIDKEDRILPRLKIAQPTSPEVGEGLVKLGNLYNVDLSQADEVW